MEGDMETADKVREELDNLEERANELDRKRSSGISSIRYSTLLDDVLPLLVFFFFLFFSSKNVLCCHVKTFSLLFIEPII